MSELEKALDTLMAVPAKSFKSDVRVALMDKREAHLVSTALDAVSERLRMKGDKATADILKKASEKMMDSDQIHIESRIATA